jgi:hypothetical protein
MLRAAAAKDATCAFQNNGFFSGSERGRFFLEKEGVSFESSCVNVADRRVQPQKRRV